ncbi:hypothetical protein [Bradyrhizobium sp. 159]|nr:hypothetical protein [Bradyrhizobium sp. 159]
MSTGILKVGKDITGRGEWEDQLKKPAAGLGGGLLVSAAQRAGGF